MIYIKPEINIVVMEEDMVAMTTLASVQPGKDTDTKPWSVEI